MFWQELHVQHKETPMVDMKARLALVHHGVASQYEAENYRAARKLFRQYGGKEFLVKFDQELPPHRLLDRLRLADLWYFYGQLYRSLIAIKKADKEWEQMAQEGGAIGLAARSARVEAGVSSRVRQPVVPH